jgi:hypothetical protein
VFPSQNHIFSEYFTRIFSQFVIVHITRLPICVCYVVVLGGWRADLPEHNFCTGFIRLENQGRTLANIAFVIAFDVVLSWFHYITKLRKFGLFPSCCGKRVGAGVGERGERSVI